jgi:hypothetical protein
MIHDPPDSLDYCLRASPLTVDGEPEVLFRMTYSVLLFLIIDRWVVVSPRDRCQLSVTTQLEFTEYSPVLQ